MFFITGERRHAFMSFSGVIAQKETKTASQRIWIRAINSILYDNNRYAKCAYLW